MAFTAMLQVEASLNTGKWYLHQLADHLLGPWGKRIASFCILMLFYSLASAYISGGSSLLAQALADAGLPLSQEQAAWAFTLLFGGMVCVGTKQVDYLNRLMFTVKLVIMVAVLALLLPRTEGQHLLSLPLGQGLLLAGLPVIFTSFGFHGSIPSVMLYLGDCPKQLRRVFVWGSALPLILYVLWQVAILGLLGQQALLQSGGALDSLLANVGKLVSWPAFNQAMHLFADLALATSFLGVTLGLFDFMAKVTRRKDNWQGRTQTGLITFVPPLLFALYFPQASSWRSATLPLRWRYWRYCCRWPGVAEPQAGRDAPLPRPGWRAGPRPCRCHGRADRRGAGERQHGAAAGALSQSRY